MLASDTKVALHRVYRAATALTGAYEQSAELVAEAGLSQRFRELALARSGLAREVTTCAARVQPFANRVKMANPDRLALVHVARWLTVRQYGVSQEGLILDRIHDEEELDSALAGALTFDLAPKTAAVVQRGRASSESVRALLYAALGGQARGAAAHGQLTSCTA